MGQPTGRASSYDEFLRGKTVRKKRDGFEPAELNPSLFPLQLEVIRRAVQLWSNPGEVVFSPFGGIGSEPYVAVEQGRKAVAIRPDSVRRGGRGEHHGARFALLGVHMSINRVNISGNLTRDPELRATQSGTQVMSFGMAVNDRRKNQQTGEWEDYPNFVDCTMFGARAEAAGRYLSKGSKVAIEGKLRFSQWEKDGQRRSKLEVIVEEIEFMSRREDGVQQHRQQPQPAQQPYQQAAPQRQAPSQAPDLYPEDIPF